MTPGQGWAAPWETWEDRRRAVEFAFDYRGDVTVALAAGPAVVGYLANRETDDPATAWIEVFPVAEGAVRRIPLAETVGLTVTGADMAAGKSWENWLRKVAEAEANGSIAELYPES